MYRQSWPVHGVGFAISELGNMGKSVNFSIDLTKTQMA